MNTKDEKARKVKVTQPPESNDFDEEIRLQIQIVVKETATLIGLLEVGLREEGINSLEYKAIREFGTGFLNELVRTGKRLNVQLQ